MSAHVLVLRTCDKDLRSHSGFQWPKKGLVACDDWKPAAECGNGLHGLLWGVGDASYLSAAKSAKWLVVKVPAADVVDIRNKVKFPGGDVVFCGSRDSAVAHIQKRAPKGSNVVFGKFPRRFKFATVDGMQIVRDSLTGLEWQAEGSTSAMSHADAVAYCQKLGNGWRMPAHDELRTIVDYRSAGMKINEKFFKCHGWWYWTSTVYAPLSDYSWVVYFHSGTSGGGGRSGHDYVRAVRASQSFGVSA